MLPPPMTTPVWTPSCWISRDVLGDLRGDGGIDAELLLAHQGFAGELQEDAAVGRRDIAGRDYIEIGADEFGCGSGFSRRVESRRRDSDARTALDRLLRVRRA